MRATIAVSGTANDGGEGDGLKGYVVCLGSQAKAGSWSNCPHTGNWSKSFDTKLQTNGSKTLKACAYCCADPPHYDDPARTVTIDNHYLCDVVRNSSVTFKYYTVGGAWNALSGLHPWAWTEWGKM